MLPGPYLLHLGSATDALAVKTARGVLQWRPHACLAQRRLPDCSVDLGLPEMTFAEAVDRGARTLVLGSANAGGVMGRDLIDEAVLALEAGLNVASGLHDRLVDQPEIASTASRCGRRLFDLRTPPHDLQVGAGVPRAGFRLLTVGTDCSVGKMYTSLALERGLRQAGLAADFRATGQTGILIAGEGVPVDAVVADFISGAVERISPARHDGGWDVIEGQGSLFHPSYAGVSLGLLHGAQPDAIVLCHEPGRRHMRGLPGRPLPDLAACLEANLAAARLTNPAVQAVGVALNTATLDEAGRAQAIRLAERDTGLPCVDPLIHGVAPIIDRLLACYKTSPARQTVGA
ncbi:MAG: DUF1611 domain-containing protein [Brevundimonas sp.]|uniref:N-acetyltransferase DgcN n=1 Tax=Brevundimonas sp. TaxID=1871086 RepID=UPI0018118E01|nr:N-acetyltransferase DgcN [Brevundimonas sp.]MBA4804900.1 DUF1611 domain-containing protein [Brevundimonas sp.]